ncbi:MAG: hypothetical protein JW781_01075 [Deltaproteobacteria bacterium]|nr:hypothetical protein [Candidatus Anaeroferrophillacea bacterium]
MNSTPGTGVFSRGGIFTPGADVERPRNRRSLSAPALVAQYIVGRLGGIAAELNSPADITLDFRPLERTARIIGVSADMVQRVIELFADRRLIENHQGRVVVTNLTGIRRLAADHQ